MRAFIFGEKVEEFVAEDGGAAWLQNYDWSCRLNFGQELVHDFEEQSFGAIEHAYVVEWASTAKMGARDGDFESGGFQNLSGGYGGRRQEIIVEGVGP